MNTIKLIPANLTAENFSQFGEVLSIENQEFVTINDGYANKYADLAKIDTQEEQGETTTRKGVLPLGINV